MRKYNWLDVQDLANRLQPTFGSDERAQEDGEQIEREAAKQRFWASTVTLRLVDSSNLSMCMIIVG